MLFLEKLSVNPEWKRLQARGMWNIEYNLRIWNCTVSDKWMFKSDRKAAESTDEWKYNKSESLFIVPKREIKVAARAQSRWQNKIRHNLHNDNKSKSSPELIPEIGNYSQSLQTLRPPPPKKVQDAHIQREQYKRQLPWSKLHLELMKPEVFPLFSRSVNRWPRGKSWNSFWSGWWGPYNISLAFLRTCPL